MRDLGIDSAKAMIRTPVSDACLLRGERFRRGRVGSGAVIKQWSEKGGAVLFERRRWPTST